MSMGADFYAMSDEQLQLLLDEKIDYGSFLYDELDFKPRACFTAAELIWVELTELLIDEIFLLLETTYVIPEQTGYAFSNTVKVIARNLSELNEDKFRQYFDMVDTEKSYDEIYKIVVMLTGFYQRAAQNGDAVIFRIT